MRRHQAQCRLRKLKREERNKKIKKNKRLSDVMSKVSYRTKKNYPRAAGDISLSSLYFSPGHIKRVSVPTVKEEEETKAALVIERFFIKIKAEVEWEIAQLEQRELSFKRNSNNKRKGRMKRSSPRNEGKPCTLNTHTSTNKYCASPSKGKQQSQYKGVKSSRFNSASASSPGGQPRKVASCRKGTTGSRAKQGLQQADYATGEKRSNLQQHASTNVRGHHPPHGTREALTSKERVRHKMFVDTSFSSRIIPTMP